jgi:hypothetical protein
MSPPSSGSNRLSKIPAWKQVVSWVIGWPEISDYTGSKTEMAVILSSHWIPVGQNETGFLDKQIRSFPGPHKLLFSSPIGSLGGRVTAQQFHTISWQANRNWSPLFHFSPASYTIWNFWPADYSACHLLLRWNLAWPIQPWRWRRYVLPKRRLTCNWLHGVISQKLVLFRES